MNRRVCLSPAVKIFGTAMVAAMLLTGGGATAMAVETAQVQSQLPDVVGTPSAATIGLPYSYQLTYTGGASFVLASGLPAGLTMNNWTGLITGTPEQENVPGSVAVKLTIYGASGTGNPPVAEKTIPFELNRADVDGTPPPAQLGVPYSYQLTYTSGASFVLASGLPAGLTMNNWTGLITGTPEWGDDGYGSYPVKLTIYGANVPHPINEKTISMELGKPSEELMPGVSGDPVDAQAGQEYSHQFTISGPGTHLRVSGLPSWLRLDGGTGQLTGTAPAFPDRYQFTVIARNDLEAVSKTFTLDLTHPTKHLVLKETIKALDSIKIPAFTCPADTPYLEGHFYSPGRFIPRGAEIIEPGGIGVNIGLLGGTYTWTDGFVSGWQDSIMDTATNHHSAPATLEVYANCTNDPDKAWVPED